MHVSDLSSDFHFSQSSRCMVVILIEVNHDVNLHPLDDGKEEYIFLCLSDILV